METLEEPTEPPERNASIPCFDASQYPFFSSNTTGLELGSNVGLEEGVDAPPEEDFFNKSPPSTELDSHFGFDSYYEPQFRKEPTPSSSLQQPPQSVLFVSDLEKQMQSASLKNQSPLLSVTEIENQQNRRLQNQINSNFTPQGIYPFPINSGNLFPFQNPSSSLGISSEFLSRHHHHQQQPPIGSIGSSSQHSTSGFPQLMSGGGVSSLYYNSGGAHMRVPAPPIPSSGIQKYKYMTSSEIEKILSSQVQNIHIQNPYSDDYYYHAFIKKYRRGACRFTPVSVKEVEHGEQAMKAEVKFADLQGLGKIPFSNLRTPRPLIDFLDNESLASAEEDEAMHGIQWEFIRSAHRQQAMQARKLIEDSMCLLLEVDDVDRLATSECGKVDLRKLASRRRDLIGSIVEAFRIPSTPEGNLSNTSTSGKYVANSDGVFLRLMSIAKGRSLLAKLLNVLVPPRPFQALPTDTNPLSHICWTTLRNIRALFGPLTWITRQGIDVDVSSLTAETSKIAAGLKEVILALRSANDVCCAFEALAKGDLMSSSDGSVVTPEELLLPFLPPNHIPGKKTGIWLEQVLVALLQRALEVGLAQRICFTHPTGAFIDFELMMKWDEVFGVLYEALTAHLKILGQVQLVAKERNQPQALQYADGLRGRELLKAALTLCNQFQLFKLKQLVSALL